MSSRRLLSRSMVFNQCWIKGVAFGAAGTLFVSCNDGPNAPPTSEPLVVVSDPLPVTPADLRVLSAGPVNATEEQLIVYVSLPPGSAPAGVTATIGRAGQFASSVTSIVDGGFDPVAVAVGRDDSVSVTVTDISGAVVLSSVSIVRAHRPPVVVRTSPPRKKSDLPTNLVVAVNAVVEIVFSEPMNQTTVSSSIRLFRGANPVTATAQVLSGTGAVVILQPSEPLAPNTDYRAVVSGSVADLDGELLAEDVVIDFTTGQAASDPASIRVSPDTVFINTFVPGTPTTYQLTATVRDAGGNTLIDEPVTWSSNDPNGLTVSRTGLVSALKSGEYTVAASAGELSASSRVHVRTGPPTSASLTPATAVIEPGDTILLSVTYRDAGGFVTVRPSTFTSSSPSVATIGSGATLDAFRVVGVREGTAVITVSHESVSASASITVLPASLTVVIAPDSLETVPQAVIKFSALTLRRDGIPIEVGQITWSSLDPDVVTVESDGTVTAVRAGTGRIVAKLGAASDTTIVTANLLEFKSVHGGSVGVNMCALTTVGRAYCWGNNGRGQLGAGFRSGSVNWPVAVAGNIAFSTLSVSLNHTCGRSLTGSWYCWGYGLDGRLGNVNRADELSPVAVTNASSGFMSIVATDIATCGLSPDRDAYCWGSIGGLPTSVENNNPSLNPVLIPGAHKYASLNAHAGLPFIENGPIDDVCGLTLTGAVYCWSVMYLNSSGEIDVLPDATGFAFSALGSTLSHQCGLAEGRLRCWGFGTGGQLGNGSNPEYTQTPVQVSGDHVFSTTIALSWAGTSCALTTDGDAYCWGRGDIGNLGSGSEGPDQCADQSGNSAPCSKTPLRVTGGLKFKSLAASRTFCAVTTDNVAYCWGPGLLGNGNTEPSFAPLKVAGQQP